MMYARTSSSQQFMAREAEHSTKGSRRGFVDVETGVDPSSLHSLSQRRDSLARALQALVEHRKESKFKIPKGEYDSLGKQIQELQNQIGELNKLRPSVMPNTFDRQFVQAAKFLLPAHEFERISEAARRRMIEAAGGLDGATP